MKCASAVLRIPEENWKITSIRDSFTKTIIEEDQNVFLKAILEAKTATTDRKFQNAVWSLQNVVFDEAKGQRICIFEEH